VRRGDTLSSIARHHHVGTADLRAWNGLTQNRIIVGQRLRIVAEPPASVERKGHGAHRKPVVRETSAPKSAPKSRKAATHPAAQARGKSSAKPAVQATASDGRG
jgi:lipoprotein NlpD